MINSVDQLVIEKSFTIHGGFNSINMNIENLPEGIYFVEITNQNNLLIQKSKILKN